MKRSGAPTACSVASVGRDNAYLSRGVACRHAGSKHGVGEVI